MFVTKKEKDRIVFEKKALLYSSIFSISLLLIAIAFSIYENHLVAAGNALLFLLILCFFSFSSLNDLYIEIQSDFPNIIIKD